MLSSALALGLALRSQIYDARLLAYYISHASDAGGQAYHNASPG